MMIGHVLIRPFDILGALILSISLIALPCCWGYQCGARAGLFEPTAMYPQSPSLSQCFVPWIWDAVIDRAAETIEVLLQPRCACDFNVTQWQRVVQKFPQYAPQLAFGDPHSILAPRCPPRTHNLHVMLHKQTVICLIPRLDSPRPYRVRSRKIFFSKAMNRVSPVRVVCPLHGMDNRSVNTEGFIGIHVPKTIFTRRRSPLIFAAFEELYPNATRIPIARAPFCEIPVIESSKKGTLDENESQETLNTTNQSQPLSQSKPLPLQRRYQYEIAMCSVIGDRGPPDKRKELLAWIEYHRLIGVQHFFLYDFVSFTHLADLLVDYIKQGLVSVTPWPHENCVRGLGSGRQVQFNDTAVSNETEHFNPPARVNQISGLASCYLRNRHRARFMLSMDDDEFIVFNPGKIPADTRRRNESRLQQFLRQQQNESDSDEAETTIAYSFQPLMAGSCPNRRHRRPESPYLAIDELDHVIDWNHYEQKMLMRTSAVHMFMVHYVIEVDPAYNNLVKTHRRQNGRIVNSTDAILLHLRRFDERNILGQFLPVNVTATLESFCQRAYYLPLTTQRDIDAVQDQRQVQYQILGDGNIDTNTTQATLAAELLEATRRAVVYRLRSQS